MRPDGECLGVGGRVFPRRTWRRVRTSILSLNESLPYTRLCATACSMSPTTEEFSRTRHKSRYFCALVPDSKARSGYFGRTHG